MILHMLGEEKHTSETQAIPTCANHRAEHVRPDCLHRRESLQVSIMLLATVTTLKF